MTGKIFSRIRRYRWLMRLVLMGGTYLLNRRMNRSHDDSRRIVKSTARNRR